jgi:nitrogen fixation protein NifM
MSDDKKNPDAGELAYYLLRAALNRFHAPPSELKPEQTREILQQARTEHALESKILCSAEARNVVIPAHVQNASIAALETRYECREDFKADLERNGLDLDLLCESLHRQHRVEAVLDRVCAQVARVTESDAERYYYRHIERFIPPETRTARHILITINDDFAENRAEAAYARIDQILCMVRHAPTRFAEQAQLHSECPSSLRGGLLGRLPRGRLYSMLDDVLFELGAGGISDVIRSPVGLHVLYCEEIHSAEVLPFEAVMPRIIERLTERRQQRYQQSWIKSLPG